MAQNNTRNHYKDDKVDWFIAHMDQVANAHVAGLFAYHNSGGTALK
ncbi:hypothetical protein [Streptomyces chartreusis]